MRSTARQSCWQHVPAALRRILAAPLACNSGCRVLASSNLMQAPRLCLAASQVDFWALGIVLFQSLSCLDAQCAFLTSCENARCLESPPCAVCYRWLFTLQRSDCWRSHSAGRAWQCFTHLGRLLMGISGLSLVVIDRRSRKVSRPFDFRRRFKVEPLGGWDASWCLICSSPRSGRRYGDGPVHEGLNLDG